MRRPIALVTFCSITLYGSVILGGIRSYRAPAVEIGLKAGLQVNYDRRYEFGAAWLRKEMVVVVDGLPCGGNRDIRQFASQSGLGKSWGRGQ